MGRAPCCEKVGLKRGRWTAEEDELLTTYIQTHGEGSWRSLPKNAGLLRCGKSCRLRWINYLRADVKRGNILPEEENTIIKLHSSLGNRWSLIASHMPGRTDNEIKNYWNSHLSRKIHVFKTSSSSDVGNLMSPAADSLKVGSVTMERRESGKLGRWANKKPKSNQPRKKKLPPTAEEETSSTVTTITSTNDPVNPLPETQHVEKETMLSVLPKSDHADKCLEDKETEAGEKQIVSGPVNSVTEGSEVMMSWSSPIRSPCAGGDYGAADWAWDDVVHWEDIWDERGDNNDKNNAVSNWWWENDDRVGEVESMRSNDVMEPDNQRHESMVAWLLS